MLLLKYHCLQDLNSNAGCFMLHLVWWVIFSLCNSTIFLVAFLCFYISLYSPFRETKRKECQLLLKRENPNLQIPRDFISFIKNPSKLSWVGLNSIFHSFHNALLFEFGLSIRLWVCGEKIYQPKRNLKKSNQKEKTLQKRKETEVYVHIYLVLNLHQRKSFFFLWYRFNTKQRCIHTNCILFDFRKECLCCVKGI